MKRTCLYGGPLFDGTQIYEKGAVLFGEQGVLGVAERDEPFDADEVVHVGGDWILPGLVDLHSDTLERCVEMRPGVFFDVAFALENLDRRVAACGITTFCHAVSFADHELGLRSPEKAEELVRCIHDFAASGRASVRHRVHGRYEVGSRMAAQALERLLDQGLLDLVSFMDHTPGQGQFRSFENYLRYYMGTFQLSREEVERLAEVKRMGREEGWREVVTLAEKIRAAGLPFWSHDDDSEEKVVFVRELGVGGCEFPVCLDAARSAKERGMFVCMGAPNLVRGSSSNGHLAAREAVEEGACDGLVSDYYPECLLQSAFIAGRCLGLAWPAAFSLVTSLPGGVLGSVWGRLLAGGPADLVVVNAAPPWARVVSSWVRGRCVYLGQGFRREGAELREEGPRERAGRMS
ncbi:alpha-D-ribose 1-methylphosphonate 5-triphosphate diphosphatase [Desulfoglaeba alkanexedens]|uniref:Alpha-D-ribose 1-methylphosphonate 5-triphosphate diphosphatase n=1 Tax=Desulfoglaeba alkanexedens ALDC TaxID=980445 RepID=A0A4P8L0H7_9BACT|nr:alpha-D-ribose 1-methylphosphonate 5-triphosphate diphosphatase [Desulfoglaeba alkanexedens]QCQ21220.1 alpha-D-ribose 1-methylphosphonate 5-triphosphate diphosphatase [Desulfoglaeba alkanexedens ALDC]